MRRRLLLTALLTVLSLSQALDATATDRDFSGKWSLDANASDTASLGKVETSLDISQGAGGILCSSGASEWSYALDGSPTTKQFANEKRISVTKWEGAALLVNTQVSATQQYTIMDRWEISKSRNTLTISRQVVTAGDEKDGTLVYRRDGSERLQTNAAPPAEQSPAGAETSAPPHWRQDGASKSAPQSGLATRDTPSGPPDITVASGTRVLLSLIGEVNTKYAKEGDQVYLRTAAPVAAGGRVVIPRNSDVQGTITKAKAAGKVVGKGELYIRFDQLILPNGVSRDFRARPMGEEGKVDGHGKSADGRTVMEGAGMGATVGAITRGLGGAAVGGVGGALAGVLLSRNQNVILPAGTHLEMVLDRDLVFHPEELP